MPAATRRAAGPLATRYKYLTARNTAPVAGAGPATAFAGLACSAAIGALLARVNARIAGFVKSHHACATNIEGADACGWRGPAQWRAGGADAAAGAAGHRHRVSPHRPAAAGGHPRERAGRHRHPAGLHAVGGRRQGAYRGAPDVGLCRPGAGQPLHRHHGRGSADPRRLGFLLRLPAAKRRHRVAEGAAQVPARAQAGGGARGRGRAAQVGAPGAAPRLHAELRDRLPAPGGGFNRAAGQLRHGHRALQPRHRARAPSLSARTWR